MKSKFFKGKIIHTRCQPTQHQFEYPITYFYLYLPEIHKLQTLSKIFSIEHFNALSFHEKNYLSAYQKPLISSVQQCLHEKHFLYKHKHIYLLTQVSHFGFCYNPVSFFYCFNEKNTLEYILAEVHNTPWNERYTYVLDYKTKNKNGYFKVSKKFHISPFFPMALEYQWRFEISNKTILTDLSSFQEGQLIFNATLSLQDLPLTAKNLMSFFKKHPFMSVQILKNIYWHAFKLWAKKTPFYTHPTKKGGLLNGNDS